MSPAIAAVVAMYGAFMAVGWIASCRVREGTAAELIAAGRSMPFWVAALTMTETWVDGGYLLGTFTVPPLLMGVAALAYPWSAGDSARLQATPADAMPLLFAQAVPPVVGLLGLAATRWDAARPLHDALAPSGDT